MAEQKSSSAPMPPLGGPASVLRSRTSAPARRSARRLGPTARLARTGV
ncbi:hypothetical protein ABZ865_24615 [Streptomyces sp. NPDC047085]